MKAILALAAAMIVLASAARAAETASCNVTVDVTDTDPKGTNVRDMPGGKTIAVLAQPVGADDWIEVHVTGQSGDWFQIDGAKAVGDDETPIFHGKGFVHKSVLGMNGLQTNTEIWADHDVKSRLIGHGAGDEQASFLGCFADFAKVRTPKVTGWTKGVCTNQRTTCA